MDKLESLALFVGTGKCNAHCAHCAGRIHRKFAPRDDGVIDEDLINKTLRDCYSKGARSLSITSSGEPTLAPLSVTRTLELFWKAREEGIVYPSINLYSNGILIGNDERFSYYFLPRWRELGLRTIYITIHDVDETKNAKIYGVDIYPNLDEIFLRIHNSNLLVRGNLVISRNNIDSVEKFVSAVESLKRKGIDYISAWQIRNKNDKLDKNKELTKEELAKISKWIKEENSEEFKVRLYREEDRKLYRDSKKLTLFPDGTLSSSWCNN